MNGQLLTAVGVVKVDPAAMDDAWATPAELDQTRPAKAIKPQGDHFLLKVCFGRLSHLPNTLLEELELELLPKSWGNAFLGAGSLPSFRILSAL
jgi:hypothetical protein